jgi:N-ethylmaleimide reductase
MREYYGQRASEGGFIVSEGTSISATARGWFGAPGLYSDQQVEGWRKITAAVRSKGAHIFSQLWHTGRSSHNEMTGGVQPVSASVNPSYWEDGSHLISTPRGWEKPSPHRALDITEIPNIIEDYWRAAQRAKSAGFEGVELHAGNGYLIDQFLQNGSNHRVDRYGGCIENRSRFLLEVVDALVSVWGADRVAVRIAPSGTWNGMSDSDPQALFDHVVSDSKLNATESPKLFATEKKSGDIIVLLLE